MDSASDDMDRKPMKRKIYQKLLEWKEESNGHTALLVEGARRVGKSYIVEQFARNEYGSYILINFGDEDDAKYKELFEMGIGVKQILTQISLISGIELVERNSLIILDEIQLCPKARQAIKFLVQDGRYDYIETGSLMSIKENVKGIVLPSEERSIKMFPMDFEEFCWAMGDKVTIPAIREHFNSLEPFETEVHKAILQRFRTYMIVGGMPTAVETYSRTEDLMKAEIEKRAILDLYRNDARKHGIRTRRTLEEIPALLMKHDKTIQQTSLDRNTKAESFEDTLFWLDDSMVANICYDTMDISIGLMMNMERTSVKCYMGDTGLLLTLAMMNGTIPDNSLLLSLLNDKLHVNEGMMMENIVSQMLRANSHELLFHSFYNREDNNNRYEIDFLIRKGGKICPIEVKSGDSTKHASLDRLMSMHSKALGQPYIINTKNVRKVGNICFIPIYMTICL